MECLDARGRERANTQTTVAVEHDQPLQNSDRGVRILVVDDEDTIRLVLAKYLRSRGFEVAAAESGDAALEMLASGPFDLILCDVRMPGLSGLDLVPRALDAQPDVGIVMLSAVNDAPTATQAMAQGVLDYLTKPIELQTLYDAVMRALHKRSVRNDTRRIEAAVREAVALRTRDLERETDELRELTIATLTDVVSTMEGRDPYQHGRSTRIGDLAASIAEYLEFSLDVIEDVRVAGRLHDIGNVGIPEGLLTKPGSLTAGELTQVKMHVRIGLELLSSLHHIERARLFIADHHERWDGSGYPLGKCGDEISIGGRILAAVDAFDALSSRRAYREPMTPLEALDILESDAGTQLDPRVYEALRAVVKRRKSLVLRAVES
ncbi:MAG TPA: HD domain-containing phosphohydrolase [Gemmatimonadaceae bacterium]|nr:HD domain-containing phosphohydrolase [Gemmatimonadaceae bacterium]